MVSTGQRTSANRAISVGKGRGKETHHERERERRGINIEGQRVNRPLQEAKFVFQEAL